MSETNQEGFKPIETQEELDNIIKERLKRERESTQKRESDEQTIADLTAKNKAYETASLKSRIAHEVGLSYEWTDRIGGEDEESIRKDAESLKKLVGAGAQPIPTKNTEAGEDVDSGKAALRKVLNGIKTN